MKLKQYPKYKDAGLPWIDQIPEHWNVLPNRAVFEERNTRGMGREELLSVTIKRGVLRQKELIESSSKKDSSNEDKSKYKLVLEGDLPYNKMRMWQGAVGVSRYRGIVSPAYIILKPRDNAYSDYYHYLLRAPEYVKESYRYSYGICDDQLSLRFKDFKVIKSIVPPIEEQKIIVHYLKSKEKKIVKFIHNKRRLIQLLKEQKQAIINQAVTRGINPDVKLKPSGIDWIGDIPEHWEICKLKNIGYGIIGLTFSPADLTDESGLRVLRASNIRGGKIVFGGDVFVKKEVPTKLFVRKNDILICSRSGSRALVGKCALIGEEVKETTFGVFMTIYRSSMNDFVYYVLNSSIFGFLAANFSTSTINQLTLSELHNLIIPLPPREEQIFIVNVIKSKTKNIDSAIEKAEKEIKLIQEYRTRLISDVVTGKVDVRDIKVEDVTDEETIDNLGLSEDEQELGDSVEEVLDEE